MKYYFITDECGEQPKCITAGDKAAAKNAYLKHFDSYDMLEAQARKGLLNIRILRKQTIIDEIRSTGYTVEAGSMERMEVKDRNGKSCVYGFTCDCAEWAHDNLGLFK